MNLPPTSAEEEALAQELARNALRRETDKSAGLYNELLTGPGRWRQFLEESHQSLFDKWPELHDAMVDARRWENPVNFNGSFAEKVARAKPLPAISTVGQLERILMRTLVMMQTPQPERERLIKEAYAAEVEARKLSEAAAVKKLGIGEIDVSSIKF